jgi:hypothetical protein
MSDPQRDDARSAGLPGILNNVRLFLGWLPPAEAAAIIAMAEVVAAKLPGDQPGPPTGRN